jgi:hypothetical protein
MKARRSRGWRRTARLYVGLLVIAMLGQGAAMAEAAAASFFIEKITVETERLSPEIVLSESLLREGREYSESELREAVHRINRLPFVLLAEFSLRKGSERGRYELVVKVYEARRWFSQLNLGIAVNDPIDRFRAEEFSDRSRRFIEDNELDALIGRRFAVGRRGLLFASFGSEAGLFAFGYQHYNLFDRNILFSVTVAGEDEYGTKSRAARAQLGIPIRGNHGLRLLAGWNRIDAGERFLFGFDVEEMEAGVAWVFNSLDDPVLPREGRLLEAGLTWLGIEDRRSFLRRDGTRLVTVGKDDRVAVVGSASRHWPVKRSQSVSVGIRAFLGDGSVDGRQREAEAIFGHQVFLLRNQEPGKWRELRFETELSGEREEYPDSLVAAGLPAAANIWRLSTGLTYRNGWGLFRFFVVHAERSFDF